MQAVSDEKTHSTAILGDEQLLCVHAVVKEEALHLW
jgi:hypothetical protein